MTTRPPAGIEGLLSTPTRRAILTALVGNETLSFGELQELVQTSAGNLSTHLRRLEEAGYVTAHRHFEDRAPRRDYSITPGGLDALNRYLEEAMANPIAVKRSGHKKP